MYPILQKRFIEVEKQTHGDSGKLHIGQELRLMDRKDGLDRLDLNDQAVFHDQIRPKVQLQVLPLVNHRKLRLPIKLKPGLPQFKA